MNVRAKGFVNTQVRERMKADDLSGVLRASYEAVNEEWVRLISRDSMCRFSPICEVEEASLTCKLERGKVTVRFKGLLRVVGASTVSEAQEAVSYAISRAGETTRLQVGDLRICEAPSVFDRLASIGEGEDT